MFCVLYFALSAYRGYKFYNSVFRLSYEQISSSMDGEKSYCNKFKECELQPGDIIIRRYITDVTNRVDAIFDPYFLHSAFYIGDDEMFEVWGIQQDPENQIIINKLSKSDWFNEDMTNFVIIRPKNYYGNLEKISYEFRNVANDPEFLYGTYNEDGKRGSCADIILKYLEKNRIIKKSAEEPEIITPDYLFWALKNDPSNFDVVGYNINPRENAWENR